MADKGSPSDKAHSVSSKTLFVRNLPYSSRDADLEAAFSDYGSLKSCFTVKEKGVVNKCRGFGYVTFATREEAEKARSAVKVIGKRPVQISFANKKLSWKQRKQKQSPAAASGVGSRDEDKWSDGDVSEEAESEDDYEAMTARKADEAPRHHRQHKPKAQRGQPKFDTGRVLVLDGLPETVATEKILKKCSKFGTVEDVIFPVPNREAPTAFVTYKTHREARQGAAGLEGNTYKGSALGAVVLSREGKAVSKKTLKKSNLIVRNLSFQCSETDIREVFSPFGEITEIRVPRKPNGRMLGFAFVQFSSYFSATRALGAVNGREIGGRTVAVDWVVPKDKYQESLREQPVETGQTTERQGAATQGGDEEGEEQGAGSESEDGGPDSDVTGISISDEERCVEGGGEEAGWRLSDESEEGGSAESDSEAGSSEDEQEEKKPFKEDVHEGKTLFIRCVPFDADEEELSEVLSQFGALRYCRLVTNPETGMCRGSAFAQYFSPSSVQACLEAGSTEHSKGIHYGGRRLDVTMAMSKQDVKQLQEQKQPQKQVDKRNLYLSKEGAILPNSEAAEDLSKADMAKRLKALSEKKNKLANPNFFVSKTRLSVRNIPTQVNEKQLKDLLLKAAGGPPARIKQVKIMRSSERVDSVGIGRSKGFAFVDFTSHEAALMALRATNNNPKLFGPKKRLIVEFAVEDSRAVKLREQRKRQLSARRTSSSNTSKKEDNLRDDSEPTVPSARTKWKLKCKAKRLRRKEKKQEEESLPSSAKTPDLKETSIEHPPTTTQLQSAAVGTKRKLISRTNEKAKNHVATKKFKTERGTPYNPELARLSEFQKSKNSDLRMNEDTPSLSTASTSKRNVKLQKEDREEENFTRMVDNYKRKLFGSISGSRWFE